MKIQQIVPVALMLCLSTGAMAQSAKEIATDPQQFATAQANDLSSSLGLNEEQTEQVLNLYITQEKSLHEVRQQQAEMEVKVSGVTTETNKQIMDEVLTDEQREKMKSMMTDGKKTGCCAGKASGKSCAKSKGGEMERKAQ